MFAKNTLTPAPRTNQRANDRIQTKCKENEYRCWRYGKITPNEQGKKKKTRHSYLTGILPIKDRLT